MAFLFRGNHPFLGNTEIQHDGSATSPLVVKNASGTEIYSLSSTGAVASLLSLTAVAAQHLTVNTVSDDKQVRINSRSYTQATGDSIGFQSKPSQTVTTTGTVFGGQISPRLQSAVAAGNIIGLDLNTDLKGTAAGAISGDVRALNLELVTDDAGVRAISGNVNAIRVRAAFSGSVSGKVVPIRIEKMEAQTGSEQWDAVLELPSTNAGIWHDDPNTEPSTAAGYIKVLVNGNARYIQLYSSAPTD